MWDFSKIISVPSGAVQYVTNVQHFSITISAGNSSNTATISSVDTSRSFIVYSGVSFNNSSGNTQNMIAMLQLTNATTITASRTGTGDDVIVRGCIVNCSSSFVSGVQQGTVSISSSTSGTATISSVTTSRSAVFFLGANCTSTGGAGTNAFTNTVLTNSTTVTANIGASTSATVGFVVVEFEAATIQSIQAASATDASSSTTMTSTISSVTTTNTILAYGGQFNGNAQYSQQSYSVLTNATTITWTRTGTNTSSRTGSVTAIEFVAGILTQNVQRGTIDLTGVSTNTATITASATSRSALTWGGFTANVNTNPAQTFTNSTLTNSTTVTADKNSSTGNSTISYSVAEFN